MLHSPLIAFVDIPKQTWEHAHMHAWMLARTLALHMR